MLFACASLFALSPSLAFAQAKNAAEVAVEAAKKYAGTEISIVWEAGLQSLRTVRYLVEYRKISVANGHAEVDIRYDASFQIATAMGDRWEHKQSDKRITLERDGNRWLIIAGM